VLAEEMREVVVNMKAKVDEKLDETGMNTG
jgi:hypothetical protein